MFQRKTTSDSRLVLSVLRGRRDDYGVLVRRYLSAVRAVAYAQLGNATDADDVAQDVFVRAFQRLDTLRDRGKFGPWLMTIARNMTTQLLRTRAREAAVVAELPTPPPSIDPDVEQRELRDTVHRAIMQLEPEQRELLLLRYFSELSIRELATLLEITPNAAKKRVQRARETLGQQMFDRIKEGEKSKDREDQVKRIMGAVMALPIPAKAAAGAGVTALVIKAVAGCVAAIIIGGAWYVANRDDSDKPTAVAPDRKIESQTKEPPSPSAAQPDQNQKPFADAAATVLTQFAATRKAETGRITGRVYDSATDEAVAGLELSLYPQKLLNGEKGSLHPVVTSEGGAYELRDLPAGTYEFRNPTLNGKPHGELDETVNVWPGKTTTYDLTLETGVSIRGVVTDANGAPLADVDVSGMTNQENRWHNTASADDGTFRIVGFGSGGTGFEVKAQKVGYAMPMIQDLTVPPSGLRDVKLVMLEEATVSGKVVDPNGKSVQGAWVAAWPLAGGDGPMSKTETQQDGSFTIGGLFPGEHRIVFGSPRGGSWSLRNEVARVVLKPAEKRAGLTLVKAREGEYRLSGRVVDSDGEPVHANVYIHQPVVRSAYSDQDGAFRFKELPEGFYVIDVDDSNTSMPRSKMVGINIPETTNLEIVLDTPAKLRGIVLDKSTGEPIRQFDLVSATGILDEINGSVMWKYKSHSDGQGRFYLDGVTPGDITLFARANGYAQTIYHVTAVKAGETREGIRIELSHGVTIEGCVMNSAHEPVPEALVYLGPIPEQQMRTHAAVAKTDAEGQFTVHVAPGDTQTLSAYHTSYAPAETEVRLAGAQVGGAEIILLDGGTIEGSVFRGEESVAGGTIALQIGGVHMDSAIVDEQGGFRFVHVPPCTGTLRIALQQGVSDWSSVSRDFVLSGSETLAIDLSTNVGTGSLRGQVTQGGQPVQDGRISFLSEQASGALFEYKRPLEPDGTYRFERVPAGPVSLALVRSDGDQEHTVYKATVNVVDGETVMQDIVLEE